jgi:hypothetical protein
MSLSGAFTPDTTPPEEMTEGEKIDEILLNSRKSMGILGALIAAMSQHPMLRAMLTASGIEV